MRKIALIFAALVILATGGLGAGELFSPKIVPADADWAVQVNVSALQKSQIYKMMERGKALRDIEKARYAILRLYEVDILRNIERITLIGLRPKAEPVVCFEGEIPRDHLLGLLGLEKDHREIPFGSTVIHTWGRHKSGAFVGDRMAVISDDLDSLKQVLSVTGGEKPDFKTESLFPRFPVQSGGGLVTAFVRDFRGMLGYDHGPAILTKVKAAIFQATEKAENALLNLHVESTSAADAAQIRQVLEGLLALASMEQERGSRFDPRNLSVSVEESRITVLLTLPIKTFVEVIEGRRSIRGLGSLGEAFFHL